MKVFSKGSSYTDLRKLCWHENVILAQICEVNIFSKANHNFYSTYSHRKTNKQTTNMLILYIPLHVISRKLYLQGN